MNSSFHLPYEIVNSKTLWGFGVKCYVKYHNMIGTGRKESDVTVWLETEEKRQEFIASLVPR